MVETERTVPIFGIMHLANDHKLLPVSGQSDVQKEETIWCPMLEKKYKH
jgi:hypothetical protein